jgi:hypothetical protein
MEGRHVKTVDIGALFAVELDVDEVFIHEGGNVGVFEALMGHDMAPVASSVTAGQQDWTVRALCFGEGCRLPGIPVNRIVLVLKQIGAGLLREAVHVEEYGYEDWYYKRNGIDSNPK